MKCTYNQEERHTRRFQVRWFSVPIAFLGCVFSLDGNPCYTQNLNVLQTAALCSIVLDSNHCRKVNAVCTTPSFTDKKTEASRH